MAVGVGDGRGCVCVFGGWALVFLGAAGDRFVATHFSLSFLLFVTLMFFLALQECRCQGLLKSPGANAEKIGSLFSSIMAEAEPQSEFVMQLFWNRADEAVSAHSVRG